MKKKSCLEVILNLADRLSDEHLKDSKDDPATIALKGTLGSGTVDMKKPKKE